VDLETREEPLRQSYERTHLDNLPSNAEMSGHAGDTREKDCLIAHVLI